MMLDRSEGIWSNKNPPPSARSRYDKYLLTNYNVPSAFYPFERYFEDWIVYDAIENLTTDEAYKHYRKIALELDMQVKSEGHHNSPSSFAYILARHVRKIGGGRQNIRPNDIYIEVYKKVSIKGDSKYRSTFDRLIEYKKGSRLYSTDYTNLPEYSRAFGIRLAKYFEEKSVKREKAYMKNENGKKLTTKYYPDYQLREQK